MLMSSVCVLSFRSDPGSTYAVVGTARDVILSPRSCSSGFLRTYKFTEDGMVLHHVVCAKFSYVSRPRLKIYQLQFALSRAACL
jgi:hypothetical protein